MNCGCLVGKSKYGFEIIRYHREINRVKVEMQGKARKVARLEYGAAAKTTAATEEKEQADLSDR